MLSTHILILLSRLLRTSLIRSISLYFLNVEGALLMKCVKSITDVFFCDMSLIRDAIPQVVF
jgi:hypothetical protein